MREIKFRAQTRIKNQWVYGSLIDYNPRDKMDIHHCTEEGCWFVNVLPETVGQYTGLKDKNGKDIYEGDLIHSKFSDGKDCNHIVVWEDGSFRLKSKSWSGDWDYDCGKLYQKWLTEQEKEVIGNIHDNPEILK